MFAAVLVDDVRQFLFMKGVDHIRRTWPGGVSAFHAHVEGAVIAERKPTFRLVQLHGGNAEVEGNAVDSGHAAFGEKFVHVTEASGDEFQAVAEFLCHGGTGGNGVGIAVDGPDRAVGGFENGVAVAARAEGAVHIDAAVMGGERLHHLVEKDRLVNGGEGTEDAAGGTRTGVHGDPCRRRERHDPPPGPFLPLGMGRSLRFTPLLAACLRVSWL